MAMLTWLVQVGGRTGWATARASAGGAGPTLTANSQAAQEAGHASGITVPSRLLNRRRLRPLVGRPRAMVSTAL